MTRWMRLRMPMMLLIAGALLLVTAGLLWAAEMKKLTVTGATLNRERKGNIVTTKLANAKIAHEDALFSAELILMESENNVHLFTCTGNPIFTDPGTRITATKVEGQSTPRLAKFIGNVKMVSTPKKKEDEKAQSETKKQFTGEASTTTCDTLTYNYSQKIGKAEGHVVVVQKERTIWADEATYDQNLDLISLRGNIRMKNTGKEEVKELKDADTATISLANDWLDIVATPGGLITMELEVQDEEPEKK